MLDIISINRYLEKFDHSLTFRFNYLLHSEECHEIVRGGLEQALTHSGED